MLTSTHDVPDAIDLMDATARRLHDAAGREGVEPGVAARLRRMADDLSSHALAARVLATSGASSEKLDDVLQRAVRLLDGESLRP